MKINEDKTKVMLFNRAKKTDFMPKLELTEVNPIEVVEEFKLLGIMITSDLKWTSNTKLTIAKCYKRMWMLRNLKKFGTSENNLIEVYYQQVIRITEMVCPVWNAGITQQEVREIERIQRVALAVIRVDKHTNYKEALDYFKLETLENRREKLCLTLH